MLVLRGRVIIIFRKRYSSLSLIFLFFFLLIIPIKLYARKNFCYQHSYIHCNCSVTGTSYSSHYHLLRTFSRTTIQTHIHNYYCSLRLVNYHYTHIRNESLWYNIRCMFSARSACTYLLLCDKIIRERKKKPWDVTIIVNVLSIYIPTYYYYYDLSSSREKVEGTRYCSCDNKSKF